MKLTLIVILFLFSNHDEVVNYRALTWEDFRGKPVPGVGGLSTTKIIYGVHAFHGVDNGKDSIRSLRYFAAKATFDPSKSFMMEQTPRNLEHEQIHFDITELFARKLNNLYEKPFNYTYKQRDIPKRLYDSVVATMREMQRLYEMETNKGQNVEAQALWRIRLDGMLRGYPIATDKRYFFEMPDK